MDKKELSQEAMEIRRAYSREWHRKNPDKNREYKTRYWERKAEKATIQQFGQEAQNNANQNN